MKRFVGIRLLALVVGLSVVSLAFAVVAVSATPLHGSFHDDLSFNYNCPGAVLLHEDAVENGDFTVYFDANGVPETVTVHHHFRGLITNAAGDTFIDRADWTDFIDLAGTPGNDADDTVTEAGAPYKIHTPSGGIVVQNTGLIIFRPDGTLEVRGPHEQLDVVGDDFICAQLG
jgi:hypothetical protein